MLLIKEFLHRRNLLFIDSVFVNIWHPLFFNCLIDLLLYDNRIKTKNERSSGLGKARKPYLDQPTTVDMDGTLLYTKHEFATFFVWNDYDKISFLTNLDFICKSSIQIKSKFFILVLALNHQKWSIDFYLYFF